MRIHEILDNRPQIQKTFRAFVASEISHRLRPIFDLSVVPFNRIVVVFESVFPARDWHAEMQFASSVEKLVERVPVIFKSVGHERDELALFHGLVFFFFVDIKYLPVTRYLYLSQEVHACRKRAIYDVEMR